MASKPKPIPAGGRDKISVVVGTNKKGGRTLFRRFVVHTNDPKKKLVQLSVGGKVIGYVTIAPAYVRLEGPIGKPISRSVQIIALKDHPFNILDIHARHDEFIRYEIKPLDKATGRDGYQLKVENTKEGNGNYHDTIMIKTDSPHKPMLRINVSGRIYTPPSTPSGLKTKKTK